MGYWGSVVKKHLETLTELKFVANSKTDISEMIQNVDMVFVCTPTHTHYDIVKFCLLNNKDVFCEKPFTGSYDKAISLFDLAKSNKLNIWKLRKRAAPYIKIFRKKSRKLGIRPLFTLA